MQQKTMNMLKIGGAAMAVGTAAAIIGGTKKKSPSKKMKTFAKKSAKTMESIAENMGYLFH